MNSQYSLAQALELAQDPSTPLHVLAELANDHQETWPFIAANPATYPELRQWVIQQMAAQGSQPREVRPSAGIQQPESVNVVHPEDLLGTQKTKKKSQLPKSVWGVPIVAVVVVAVSFVAMSFFAPPAGSIINQEISEDLTGPWTVYLTPEGADGNCFEVSTADFAQNQAVVLVQPKNYPSDCGDESTREYSSLMLIDTATGKELWNRDLSEDLEWSVSERKTLETIPGLNEVLVRFTNLQNQTSTIIPFARLTGEVTDPAISASGSMGPPHLPELTLLRIPGSTHDVVIMAPVDQETYRYSYYRARDLTAPIWTYESKLSPVAGTPFVGEKLILGSQSTDVVEVIELGDGTQGTWQGSAGGAITIVDGHYLHVFSTGSDSDAIVFDVSETHATFVHGVEGNLRITRISDSGEQLWNIERPGAIFLSRQGFITPKQQVEYAAVFAQEAENINTRINLGDGSHAWSQGVQAAWSEIYQGVSDNTWLTMGPGAEGTDSTTLRAYDLASGGYLYELALVNPTPVLAGMTQSSGILVRSGSDSSVTCVESFELRTGKTASSISCDGEEQYSLLGGYWTELKADASRLVMTALARPES